ncbi:GNAT family N-acetyltransferase [Francisella sp. 19X1-34]|uniref:GNAT family N-acetyltransferase n=1 Tax=Francisella sp. 19X1-34 TaxID=3087177 RepID=UPI002E328D21|nr:GNAT family N-acetyltransferase [Francisella sp. 19X1-34]MED7788114.1 GNAT family N-acetyltransferase [Francisella sp. 19X1-34]
MSKQGISFSTQRLCINPIIHSDLVYERLCEILTPEVTKYLPESFQKVNSIASAREWLSIMQSQSEVIGISNKADQKLIGLLIIYIDKSIANIGYLFAEQAWHQGFANEFLDGLITTAKNETSWKRLVGGVSVDNKASSRLLEKKGFRKAIDIENSMLSYFLDIR